jgi:hypothetical protein
MAQPGRRMPRERLILGAVVFVLIDVAYFRAFRGHVIGSLQDPDDWRIPALMAAFVGTFTYLALLAIASALQGAADRRRIGAFQDGASYRDGAFAAAEGTARAADGKLLTAPFSGRECLAYEYEVWMGSGSIPGRRRSGEGRGWAGLAGVALTPTAIEGASHGVRLLGWTPLETHFSPEWFETEDPENHQKLKALIKGRKFEKMTGTKTLGLIGRLFDLQSDEDGALHQDWCLDEAALKAPDDVMISERVIQEGDHVAATGLWSAERGGLYGNVGEVGLELWPGNLDDRRRRLLVEPLARLAFMLLLCAGLHGLVALVWKSDEEVAAARAENAREKTREVFQKVLWEDLEATRAAIRAGADIEQRDHYGDTILMTAARERDPSWVKMLVEEGADIRAENPRWGSALTQAIVTNKPEAIAILKAAGAVDFRVTAENGHPLPPDGGDVLALIRRWYGAIEKGDLETVKAVHWNPIDGDIDWALWRQVRPLDIAEIGGYANDTAATVTVTGRDPAGHPRKWSYHVIRKGEGDPWRILHEWDED